MDYFHYDYRCPYLTSTNADRVCCESGSKVVCPSVAVARKYVQEFCADEEGWKRCSIARMKTGAIERKFEIQKGVREWKLKELKSQKKT